MLSTSLALYSAQLHATARRSSHEETQDTDFARFGHLGLQPPAPRSIRATVNGENVYFPDVQPAMVNGRVMVPLRGVFEHMGAHVMWNSATQTVICPERQ